MLRSRWWFYIWVVDCGDFVLEGYLEEGVLGDVVFGAAED
jgi:hypothetical protein